jgi:uncharacterized protein with HEPN domain
MNEATRKRLRDARDACRRIQLETAGLDEQIYLDATTVTYAVNWLLMVLGEALTIAVREDDALEVLIPDARAAIGLRNRIVHGYDSVDNTVIWDIAQNYVPRIKIQIDAALDGIP